FEEADRRGLFVGIDLADGSLQTGALRDLAREHPSLRIAVGHLGMVTRPGWEEQIRLACLPNVYIESGGITWLFNAEYYPYPSAVRAIRTAAEICGMHKLMWGSDYPRTMTAITYRMSWDFIEKSPLPSEEEKQLFFHENAAAFYRFGPLPELPVIRHMAE
ncbi:MAG: amidohydrolase, partial [Clostridia bacterium]|nr:amidohydrolase [Clostridia bacterium]